MNKPNPQYVEILKQLREGKEPLWKIDELIGITFGWKIHDSIAGQRSYESPPHYRGVLKRHSSPPKWTASIDDAYLCLNS